MHNRPSQCYYQQDINTVSMCSLILSWLCPTVKVVVNNYTHCNKYVGLNETAVNANALKLVNYSVSQEPITCNWFQQLKLKL